MKEVMVYVEGPSDKAAMEALLRPLIEHKRQHGVSIDFFPATEGDHKAYVLTKVPRRAVNILSNKQHALVVAMPDLYPQNKAFKHETVAELRKGILKIFETALKDKGVADARLKERFKVFCFKYDLEALILASGEALKTRLGAKQLNITWQTPVEDQNNDKPPKSIVKELFRKHGKGYKEIVDATVILGSCRYQEIALQCPQCFKPFVEFLEGL